MGIHESGTSKEPLSREQSRTLFKLLTVYRDGQCGDNPSLLFGKEIASGLPTSLLLSIVKNVHIINSPVDITDLGVTNLVQSRQIFDIVQSSF